MPRPQVTILGKPYSRRRASALRRRYNLTSIEAVVASLILPAGLSRRRELAEVSVVRSSFALLYDPFGSSSVVQAVEAEASALSRLPSSRACEEV